MTKFNTLKRKMLADPEVRKEYERLRNDRDEYKILLKFAQEQRDKAEEVVEKARKYRLAFNDSNWSEFCEAIDNFKPGEGDR